MNAVLLRELENLRRAPIESLRVKYREVFAEEPRSGAAVPASGLAHADLGARRVVGAGTPASR